MRLLATRRDPFNAPGGPDLRIQVCHDATCRQGGADAVLQEARRHRHCSAEPVPCVGLCAQSPALLLQGMPHGHMNAVQLAELLSDVGIA